MVSNSAVAAPSPAGYLDPVIEAFKKDVDRSLLRENLKLTIEERIRKAQSFHASIGVWKGTARRARLGDQETNPS